MTLGEKKTRFEPKIGWDEGMTQPKKRTLVIFWVRVVVANYHHCNQRISTNWFESPLRYPWIQPLIQDIKTLSRPVTVCHAKFPISSDF